MDRREFIGQAGAAALLVGLGTAVRAQGTFQEGKHYVRLPQPVPVSAPTGKVEVLEFFSYGCPHCSAFEPVLDAWAKKLPADVAFRRVPVNFLFNAELFQRTYFSLEALGQVEAMQRKVFAAVHVQRERWSSPDAVADFVAKHGVDRAKFLELYSSFGVQTKMVQARQLVERYKIDGVPALGVHGRYYTSPSLAGGDNLPEAEGQARALVLVDQLVARVRKG
ncbi:MAG TPA: thiol:disulfide interchange protein DsbA/DsbL [Burkholderiaceae bacterium]|nr:thiol:disulfide interchange protein DsbA/DsbL [Burkholderiaceae bacterium]HMZ01572.1 thiol:disulfide interchange protein DsbA/DsbL [Burkholderiaceae bacterium]HNB46559.1 thiol:disulfide interchange protein DsbA/DsbL [Burkholderiaceae bacterium]HNG78022.1 thiol:disulfide interchange protein DsbA/DsbL [Burkholderiaceae bacterium]